MTCPHASGTSGTATLSGVCIGCWKERAEKCDVQVKNATAVADSTINKLKETLERLEKAEAACAEMREAFKSFECTICDEDHKFRPECNACLSGQPTACTCCNEELVDCPCCMEGDYAEGYRKLRHALSSSCGQGFAHRETVLHEAEEIVKRQCEQFGSRWTQEHQGFLPPDKARVLVEALEFPLSFNFSDTPTHAELDYFKSQVTAMCKTTLSQVKEGQ